MIDKYRTVDARVQGCTAGSREGVRSDVSYCIVEDKTILQELFPTNKRRKTAKQPILRILSLSAIFVTFWRTIIVVRVSSTDDALVDVEHKIASCYRYVNIAVQQRSWHGKRSQQVM